MPFTIIIKSFPTPGQEQTQTKDVGSLTLRIGRGTDNELQLEDHSIQLNHAIIQEISGAYVLRDLSAVSLTTVNGNRTKEAILTGKGIIRIGPYTLRFSRPAPKAPLCIEYDLLSDTVSTANAVAGEATLALRISPVAGRSGGDPDATRILPAFQPPAAPAPAAAPASHPAQDSDATLVMKRLTPPTPQSVAGTPDTDKTIAIPAFMPPAKPAPAAPSPTTAPPPPAPPKPAAPQAKAEAQDSDKTMIMPALTPPAKPAPAAPSPTTVPPPPAPPKPAAAPQTTGSNAPPESLPVVLEEHFAQSSGRKAELNIPFAAMYRLDGRFLNKVTLSFVGVFVVLGIAVLGAALDKKAVFMPGQVSAKHASFVNECVRCHTPASATKTAAPDSTCTACHKSPMHFGEHSLAAPLSCTACHIVHKGNTIVASVTGKDCLRCHADLKVKNPTFDIHRSITDFEKTHPEFAIMVRDEESKTPVRVRLDDVDRVKDNAMVKLNHKLHLDPELSGLQSGPLQCTSCHIAAERKGYLMPSVKFEKACVSCHALDFDSKFSDKTVPHGRQPQELDLYLRILYTSLWPLSEDAQAGGKASANKEKTWIAEQTEKSEEKLFGKKGTRKRGKCQLCHINDTSSPRNPGVDDRFPILAETAIPDRWFLNSNFNHAAHTMAKCIACHEAAPQSEATTDVLLPKVTTCRKCHDAKGTASPSCLECHLFHEIPKPKQAQDSPDAKPPGS
ncbi:MAG: FHA domain-containing protein [Nitrospirales bacterium]|nr:FHA domain-containing protein [Nitrospirales bacterium]